MNSMKTTLLMICLLAVTHAFAQTDIEEKIVHFKPGTSSAMIEGSITGYETIDYLLTAQMGQLMTIHMETRHAANYFNVLFEDNPIALHNSSINGNEWGGILPRNGTYRIRVYLMRSAARRGETANYTLNMSITGAPTFLGDAIVPGTHFNATGNLPCSFGIDQTESAQCEFGVIRMAHGNAEVHILTPGGPERVLIFVGDKVTAETPELEVKASRSGDEWKVSINGFEHFRIPDAVIYGG